jgi:carbon monoxide dehydrogenase subunit G
MNLEGSHLLPAPRDRVWAAFTDPAILARCTPGCERLNLIGPDEYEAILKVGVAAVKGTYKGKLGITEKTPPTGYTLKIEGNGAPGFVRGVGRLTFEEQDGGTRVTIKGEAQVGGLIAAVGQRLLGSATRMLLEQFFSAMEQEISQSSGKPTAGVM